MWIALGTYWTVAEPAMAPEHHGMETPYLTHACEYETSMMLFLHGEVMRMDRVTSSPPMVDSPFYHSEHGGRINVGKRLVTRAPTGAMGETSTRHAGKGGILAERYRR